MQGTPYILPGRRDWHDQPAFSRALLTIATWRAWISLAELRNDGVMLTSYSAILASKSRDNSRAPMQSTNGDNAGFTAGEPWIGLAGRSLSEINVEAALADESSVFYTYQKLIALRKQEAVLTWGDYRDSATKQPCIVVLSP
ncbi:hypothetical protein ACNKHM_08765 [Shigella sonnei]